MTWTSKCRFALVIFSVILRSNGDDIPSDPALSPNQVPWTFVHEERKNAPATLLENTLRSTHLRAWDFVSGSSLASKLPIVFSFADDPRDKRAFMQVSRSANEMQQFRAPGEGDILGMGNNAIGKAPGMEELNFVSLCKLNNSIVHRVQVSGGCIIFLV